MPIYEYECERCHHRVELIQKRSDPPLTVCPRCQAEGAMKKLLAAPALQFKGSGFYITDYSGKGKEKDKTEGAPAESKPAAESASTAQPAAAEKKTDSGDKKKESNPSTPAPPPKSDGNGKT